MFVVRRLEILIISEYTYSHLFPPALRGILYSYSVTGWIMEGQVRHGDGCDLATGATCVN